MRVRYCARDVFAAIVCCQEWYRNCARTYHRAGVLGDVRVVAQAGTHGGTGTGLRLMIVREHQVLLDRIDAIAWEITKDVQDTTQLPGGVHNNFIFRGYGCKRGKRS